IAVVLPAAIAAFTSGQVRSSMYTDCAPPGCSVAAGVAANAVALSERVIAVNSRTHLITISLLCGDAGSGNARRLKRDDRSAAAVLGGSWAAAVGVRFTSS